MRPTGDWGWEGPNPTVTPQGADPWTGPDPTGAVRVRWLILAAGLLTLSAVLHVAAVFPAQGHLVPAFDDHAYLVVQQIVLAIGWLAVAGLAARRRPVPVIAATALALGIGAAELGIVVSNFSQVLAESTPGAGAWLFVAAWAVGVAGAVAALAATRRPGPGAAGVLGRPGRLAGRESIVMATFAALAGIVVGVALLPAWDHYVITSSSLNRTLGRQSLGSAFESGTPGGVLAGDLLTAIAFALVPLVAMWWRPGRIGVLLSGGVLVVVGAELLSAVVGFRSSAGDFGFTAAQVNTFGIRVDSSLTSWFYVELVAGVALLLLIAARWWSPEVGNTDNPALPYLPGRPTDTGGPTMPAARFPEATNGGWGPPVPSPTDWRPWTGGQQP